MPRGLSHAQRQVRDRRARPGRARPRGQLRVGEVVARAGARLSARHDLAAGAQLPQLQLRQREEPARHRRRAAARDARGRRRRAWPAWRRDGARVQPAWRVPLPPAGECACAARCRQRARGLVAQAWCRRHQRQRGHPRASTDIGRGPTSTTAWSTCARFETLAAHGPCEHRRGGCAGRGHGVPDQRLHEPRLLRAGGLGRAWPCSTRPSPCPSGWPTPAHHRPCASGWRSASACASSRCTSCTLPDNAKLPPLPTWVALPRCGMWWPPPQPRASRSRPGVSRWWVRGLPRLLPPRGRRARPPASHVPKATRPRCRPFPRTRPWASCPATTSATACSTPCGAGPKATSRD